MKKNSLTTAVVAGIAGAAGLANVATAVNLNPDGLGQVLIYPYYGVGGGNATVLSVVNTTDDVKAVKVRFLEALNSREVLDFNLYLSPFDVWTAAVTGVGTTGPGHLSTTDTSCTVPAIPAAGVDFRNFAYTGSFDDDQVGTLDRTREGHIEMIEMGVVVDSNGAVFNAATSFADAATHVAGVPAGCARLVGSWTSGVWAAGANNSTNTALNAAGGVTGPEGGLFGAGALVDVANGTAIAYNADAIDCFFAASNLCAISATTNLHTGPGFTIPTLAQASTSGPGGVEADSIVFDNGALITLDFTRGRADAVSSVFMHDFIYNEFTSASSTRADNEWVITFPTKRLHIEQGTAARRRPFTDNIDDSDGAGQVVPAGVDSVDALVFDVGGSCEDISVFFRDREEGPADPAAVIDFSPLPEGEAVGFALCFETNVVAFNQEAEVTAGTTGVLGAGAVGGLIANNVNLRDSSGNEIRDGWVRVGFNVFGDNFLLDGVENAGVAPRNQLFGLPVTGFAASNYVNANAAPGILATYAVTQRHRASRDSRSVTVAGEGTAGETITATGFAAS